MTSGYDFGSIYGAADFSGGYLYDEGTRDAVVEKSEFGRTKDGTKGAWTIVYRVSTGPGAGVRPLTMTLSISPTKNDGTPNPYGLAQMFRHLAAMGVPVPDPDNPQVILNGRFPFWLDQNTGQPVPQGYAEQIAAQMMVGKPCQITLVKDEYDGKTRNKISEVLPARPGAPTTWPEPQAQNPMAQPGFGGAPQSPYGNQAAYAQPQYGNNPPFWQQPQQPAQPAPGGWQPPGQPGVPPQQPPAAPQYPGQPAPPAQGVNPAVPSWAQPPVPGQGGTGEFTQQGQSWQPSHMGPAQGYPQQPQQAGPPQPPWQQPGQPPAGQPGPAQQMPQPPAQPPWQAPQQPGQPGQQPPPQGGAGAPPPPPWAQG